MIPRRLASLPRSTPAAGICLYSAAGTRARLLGLSWLRPLPAGVALELPGCRSIHTFGMRFPIDVLFLDASRRPLRLVPALPPRRFASCRGARSVIETRAGDGERLAAALSPARRRAAPAAPAGPTAPDPRSR